MRIRIYLVRHAEAESNANPLFKGEDILTEKGSQQTKVLAQRFKDIPVGGIYVSKITRAQLTAKEIGRVVGIEPVTKEFLRERTGSFSNDLKFSHSEKFEDLKQRLIETKSFLENVEHKHVVVMSHAIFLKSLAAYLMLEDALTEELLSKIDDVLVVDNSGVSNLVFNKEKSKWRIMGWNDLTHLAD